MTTETLPLSRESEEEFQTDQVMTIVGGHFIHDIYTASIPALLPVIIERLSLSLTMAGSLTAIQQLPALLNPLIGYLADKVSLRYFVILAPGVTATLISSMGFAPSYFILALILFATGISLAAFHAPTPAMIGRISGRKMGLGMSLYMAGGELARAAGPLLAVWAVSMWTLDGFYRIVVLGWASSAVLFWRLRQVSARPGAPASLRSMIPALRSLFLPLLTINLFRNFLTVSLAIYLPTYMTLEGSSLWIAGASLSLLELAGVGGALLSGTLSDRIGRKPILLITTVLAAIFLVLFINVDGWWLAPILIALGFTAFSATPVILAMIQDELPNNRATGNGLYMSINFLMRPLAILAIGAIGDSFGLRSAYLGSALISLLAIVPILALPERS